MSTIPLIPETAPFPPAQRAWLNGFFAGIIASANGSTATGADALGAVGTAVATPSPAKEAQAESFPWHDPAIAMEERMKLAEGSPPARLMMAAMAQLDCGTCGYNCQRYAEALASGAEKDPTRCAPGGRETTHRLKELLKLYPPQAASTPASAAEASSASRANRPSQCIVYDRQNPFPARFVRARLLSGEGSDRDVRHVVVDIKGSGLAYRAGDSLGVFADNCPDLVQSIIDLLGGDGAERVVGIDGGTTSLREALRRDFSVGQASSEMAELLARSARDAAEAEQLRQLAADETGGVLDQYGIVDLLQQFPSARPATADFVAALAPLQPRLYSISSSPRLHPDEVHLTVSVVKYTNAFGRACRGLASTCLGERMRPGQRVGVFVQSSQHFHLPADGELPVIMIGPGTGIAPFRAFLQDRKAAGQRGMNWLFFGAQHESRDFLYRQELEQFVAEGVLTRLDTAFSRDQQTKVYVQHRMLEREAEFWNWMQSGACIYVCGEAKHMAADVDAAIHRIVAEQGQMTAEEADRFVANLKQNHRYLRDVY